jgi:hypothetical protein
MPPRPNDKCFLNLNLSEGNGLTTVIELGLMGRKTIMNELPEIVKIKERGFGVVSERAIKLRSGQDYMSEFHKNEKQ